SPHVEQAFERLSLAHLRGLLVQGKRMQSPVVVAPQQRVSPSTVDIEPGTSGDEKLVLVAERVVQALDPPLPARKLVELVEDQQLVIIRPFALENRTPLNVIVPIEVGATPFGEQRLGQRRLAALSRPSEKDHFL